MSERRQKGFNKKMSEWKNGLTGFMDTLAIERIAPGNIAIVSEKGLVIEEGFKFIQEADDYLRMHVVEWFNDHLMEMAENDF